MKRLVAILVVALLVGAATYWFLRLDSANGPPAFLGYVEAEPLLVAPKATGRLVTLAVEEGAVIDAGDLVFALDDGDEAAAIDEAAARLERARAQLADLRAARQRPAQIEALEARRQEAQAALDLSRAELARQQRLNEQGVASQAQLDRARAAFRRDRSALVEIERQIEAAQLPGREAEIAAAEAEIAAGAAVLERARIALTERRVAAPRGGRVLDIYYRVGEVVPAGQPVAEILPPENIKVRFYVPETAVAALSHGQRVAIACDGCPGDLGGTITYIASESEFTPPVIFSRQERAKLVFLVEARTAEPAPALRPGLPVEVRPL